MFPPLIAAGIGGLLIGSFLNVVAHRLPAGASLVSPGSHCPGCGTPVKPYDNVPVLSWLLLRGRCRSCSEPIAARYPAVEAGTALLWLAVVAVHGDDVAQTVMGIALVTLLVPLTIIDLQHRILPNKLTGLGCVLAVALGLALDPSGEPRRLLAGAVVGGGLCLVALLAPRGMGMGDGKLLAMIGLFIGWYVLPGLLVGLLVGTVVGAIIMARVGVQQGRKTAVPFGPFLAFGALVALLAGEPLVDWYLRILG